MPKTPVIQLKSVTKKYFVGNDELTVLDNVSLEIYPGEYVMFLGPSGSGKSTILNTICGLEPPTSGEVIIRGENVAKLNGKELAKFRRSKIGIVFQQFNLIKSFKVWENVAFPLTNDGVPFRRRHERALKLLAMLGLDKYANRLPTELSGGQQQRVAIARAMATNSWIVVADEPTGNLDSKAAKEVMEILARLNIKSKRTVILVTHNPDYKIYPHRIFYVKDGRIENVLVNRQIENAPNENLKDVMEMGDLVIYQKMQEKKKLDQKTDQKTDKEKGNAEAKPEEAKAESAKKDGETEAAAKESAKVEDSKKAGKK